MLDFLLFEKSISFRSWYLTLSPQPSFPLELHPFSQNWKHFFFSFNWHKMKIIKWLLINHTYIWLLSKAERRPVSTISKGMIAKQSGLQILDCKIVYYWENKRDKKGLVSLENIFQVRGYFIVVAQVFHKIVWIFLLDLPLQKKTPNQTVFCLLCPSITRQRNKILIIAQRGCKETLNPLNKWLQSNCLFYSLVL